MIRLSFLKVLSIRVKHLEKKMKQVNGSCFFLGFSETLGDLLKRCLQRSLGELSDTDVLNGTTPIEPVKPTFSLHSDWLYHINIINSIFTDLKS